MIRHAVSSRTSRGESYRVMREVASFVEVLGRQIHPPWRELICLKSTRLNVTTSAKHASGHTKQSAQRTYSPSSEPKKTDHSDDEASGVVNATLDRAET